jgi:hypothetical protein
MAGEKAFKRETAEKRPQRSRRWKIAPSRIAVWLKLQEKKGS